MLFGDDFQSRINLANYHNQSGKIEYIHFCEHMMKLCKDLELEAIDVKMYLMPLSSKAILPRNRNMMNLLYFWYLVQNLIENTEDSWTAYTELLRKHKDPVAVRF